MDMGFVPLVAMAALVMAVINELKFLTNKKWSDALTQLCVWVAGVLVVTLAAHSDFANGITVADMPLGALNFWSLVFVGLQAGSFATAFVEVKKALDGGDSARKPPLVPSDSGPPHE